MEISDLISKKYLLQNKILHEEKDWGISGEKSSKIVRSAIKILCIRDILDYGCGRGTLKKSLRGSGVKLPIYEYDPAIEGKDELPQPADLVTCTDVLEHIEPDYIHNVMLHIYECAKRYGYFVIAVKKAKNKLPDGRNAHILLRTSEWWKKIITQVGWEIMSFEIKKDSYGKKKEIRTWLRKQ